MSILFDAPSKRDKERLSLHINGADIKGLLISIDAESTKHDRERFMTTTCEEKRRQATKKHQQVSVESIRV